MIKLPKWKRSGRFPRRVGLVTILILVAAALKIIMVYGGR